MFILAKYSNEPKTLTWGTPETIWKIIFSSLEPSDPALLRILLFRLQSFYTTQLCQDFYISVKALEKSVTRISRSSNKYSGWR